MPVTESAAGASAARSRHSTKGRSGPNGTGDGAGPVLRHPAGRRPRPPLAALRRDHPALPRSRRRHRWRDCLAGRRPSLADRHHRRRCVHPSPAADRPADSGPPSGRDRGRPVALGLAGRASCPSGVSLRQVRVAARRCGQGRRARARRPRGSRHRGPQRADDDRRRRTRRLLRAVSPAALPGRDRAGHHHRRGGRRRLGQRCPHCREPSPHPALHGTGREHHAGSNGDRACVLCSASPGTSSTSWRGSPR